MQWHFGDRFHEAKVIRYWATLVSPGKEPASINLIKKPDHPLIGLFIISRRIFLKRIQSASIVELLIAKPIDVVMHNVHHFSIIKSVSINNTVVHLLDKFFLFIFVL